MIKNHVESSPRRRPGTEASRVYPGDIVVAIVDNAYTVKHLARDKQGFYLTPGNKACPSSRPMENLELFGLVVGAFRKY